MRENAVSRHDGVTQSKIIFPWKTGHNKRKKLFLSTGQEKMQNCDY